MIDWNRALELRDEMGAEDFDEVLELFLFEVEEALTGLEEAAATPATWEASLHFLKGAALNLGFSDLSGVCERGERAAAAGDTGTITPDEVRNVYAASKTLFLEELPARAA